MNQDYQHEQQDRDRFGPLIPSNRDIIVCPDAQTTEEMLAMRRLGDREGEFITGRSYGCGPVLRPKPGPFER
jgi:hypothetical protein